MTNGHLLGYLIIKTVKEEDIDKDFCDSLKKATEEELLSYFKSYGDWVRAAVSWYGTGGEGHRRERHSDLSKVEIDRKSPYNYAKDLIDKTTEMLKGLEIDGEVDLSLIDSTPKITFNKDKVIPDGEIIIKDIIEISYPEYSDFEMGIGDRVEKYAQTLGVDKELEEKIEELKKAVASSDLDNERKTEFNQKIDEYQKDFY